MKRDKFVALLGGAWLWGAIAGLITGAIAGYAITILRTDPQIATLSARIAAGATSTASPSMPEVEVIPIESRPLLTSLPSAFDERRRSPVMQLIELTGATTPITDEQVIGTAVSVTSDGWLITSYDALETSRLANVALVRAGEVIEIERVIHDTHTDIVYLKTEASGLPVADFVQARDVTVGAAVWTERLPSVLRPASVMSIRARSVNGAVSSEKANRRFLVSGGVADGFPGLPVWDGRGKLIGLYERYDENKGGWLVQPVSSVARDLANLLAADEITHAGLSIYAQDLEGVVIPNRPDYLPSNGAWLRPGVEGFAIARTSPAFGELQVNDVIERIERDILEGEADLGEILLEYRPGATVTFTVMRADEELEVDLPLEEIRTSVVLK